MQNAFVAFALHSQHDKVHTNLHYLNERNTEIYYNNSYVRMLYKRFIVPIKWEIFMQCYKP